MNRHITKFTTCMFVVGVLLSLGAAKPAAALGSYDPNLAWPLCGRIAEDPPEGWSASQGCPSDRWGKADFSDEPISDTFGPRLLSGNYDFHRGLDIDTPWYTPVFAVTDGEVKKIDGSSNISLTLRHLPPGSSSCGSGGGCYHTRYLHLSSVVVAVNDDVEKGQLIGYSGASSATATPHLHFEVLDAPSQDAYSYWQRDCIHPLSVLPYDDDGAANMTLDAEIDVTVPTNPLVTIEVRMPVGYELDLVRVEATVYENQGGTLAEVSQTNHTTTGTTIEDTPYDVDPPWFDMEVWNRQYSYKDNSSYPYSDFKVGGDYESPYASDSDFPEEYVMGYHLDRAPNVASIGEFNGVLVAPVNITSSSTDYDVSWTFTQLVGPANADDLCVQGTATDTQGHTASVWAGNCP